MLSSSNSPVSSSSSGCSASGSTTTSAQRPGAATRRTPERGRGWSSVSASTTEPSEMVRAANPDGARPPSAKRISAPMRCTGPSSSVSATPLAGASSASRPWRSAPSRTAISVRPSPTLMRLQPRLGGSGCVKSTSRVIGTSGSGVSGSEVGGAVGSGTGASEPSGSSSSDGDADADGEPAAGAASTAVSRESPLPPAPGGLSTVSTAAAPTSTASTTTTTCAARPLLPFIAQLLRVPPCCLSCSRTARWLLTRHHRSPSRAPAPPPGAGRPTGRRRAPGDPPG